MIFAFLISPLGHLWELQGQEHPGKRSIVLKLRVPVVWRWSGAVHNSQEHEIVVPFPKLSFLKIV